MKHRIANLVLLGDLNETTKTLRGEIEELREMVKKESEFSAVAGICIRSAGLDWLNNAIFC